MGSPSSSSQSRRWADYTADEEDISPRSYCEVLRSGTPPASASSRAPLPPPAGGGVGLSLSAPRGVVPPVTAAPRPWPVDDNVCRLASLAVQPPRAPTAAARAPARGAAPWTDVRGRKRARNQEATLPAWTIRSGLPTNLAGACFNCTRTCHISAECTYETVCLRCGEKGHHARACPQNCRAGGDRRGERGLGPVAPSGLPAHQRLGPRKLEPATAAGRNSSPPVSHELRLEGGARNAPELHVVEVRARYRIPAHQRLGLGSSPPRRARTPSPPPVQSGEIIAAEAALRYALVAFVSGKRAYVTLSEAGAALAERVPRAEDNFTVHRSRPVDFLFVCISRRVRDEIMAADAAHGHDFSLRFSPWNRQLQAMQCRMRYRAHFELQGMPAHA
ncbi:hypothetical protein ACQ4PT_012961 [Festuca glaucescens]